ncbi:MAG: TonB-dependent receptor [Planctomycetota bacterium]
MRILIPLVVAGCLLITASNVIGEEKQSAPDKKESTVITPTVTISEKKESEPKEPMSHLTMDEIVVVGESISPVVTSVIGLKTIEKGRNIGIPDVLKNEPEIDISRKAAVGDTADTLTIRGMGGKRLMLNIDGRSTNSVGTVGGYFIDWGTVPIDNIERIEIIKGGGSVKYGNNAFGVINVITKKPTEKPTFALFETYGQGNEIDYIGSYRLTHTYKIGPLGYSISGSYQKPATFLWNNNFEGTNLSSNFYIDMPANATMNLGIQYANADREIVRKNRQSDDPDNPNFYKKKNSEYPLSFGESFNPSSIGTVTNPGPGAYCDKTKYYYSFGYMQTISDFLIDFKAYQNHEERHEVNYSDKTFKPTYTKPDGTLVMDRTLESDMSYGGSIEVAKPIENHEISAGVDHKVLVTGDTTVDYIDVTYNGKTMTSSEGKQTYLFLDGYYIQDNWKITKNLLLTPGVRYDIYENYRRNFIPHTALTVRGTSPSLTATNKFSDNDILTLSLYEKFRSPAMNETAWWYTYQQTHTVPELKPEKNKAEEIVFQHNFSQTSNLRFSSYFYSIKDYIIQRNFDDGTRTAYNIDKANIWGGSIEGRTNITEGVGGRANVSYQKSHTIGDYYDTQKLTSELDYMPKWKGNLGLEFKLPDKATLSITSRFIGTNQTLYSYKVGTVTKYKLMELNHYTTMDAEFKKPVSKNGELGIYIENIFNRQYEERFGYPLPGKVAGVSYKMVF